MTGPFIKDVKLFKLHADIDLCTQSCTIKGSQEAFMAEATTTRNFRENLKHFFDLAIENPVAINRATERYVLMSENEFVKMKEEIMNLQKSLISSLQIQNGEGALEENLDIDDDNDPLLQEYVAKFQNAKNTKKVKVG
jgi:hypothetical protein